jgi:4-nitrophenyl phosphatase
MMERFLAGGWSIGNVVCDLDGVVYLLGKEVPGAGRALTELAEQGHSLLFVTNNSTRTPEAVADKIRNLTGFSATADQVIGSAQAAASLLGSGDQPVLVLGGEGVRTAVRDRGLAQTTDPAEANAVVVGLDTSISYERIRDAQSAVRRGARFIATNTDATFPTPGGPWPGAGTIVAAVQTAAGVAPEVAGKPHEPIRSLIRARLGPGPTWVVGDRPDTDIALARAEGWRAVLVLTGVTEDAERVSGMYQPDRVVDSIAGLPEALRI